MIQIIAAAPVHIAPLARTMRAADRAECAAGGMTATQALESSLARSLMAWTALDDGVPCAMWGVITDSLTDQSARAWLLTGEGVERNRKAFLTHTRAWVQRVSELFPVLTAYVAADYPQALRWLQWLGFDVLPARPMFDTKALFHPVERGRHRKPFIVYGLPRSRTAWLSAFLTHGDYTCAHEQMRHIRGPSDAVSWLSQDFTGASETAASPWWRLVQHYRPDVRTVVVRRPLKDVVDSLMRIDMRGVASFDRKTLERGLARFDRRLDQIEARAPNVLSVQFADLENEATCARIYEHCLGRPHDHNWWAALSRVKIAGDTPSLTRHVLAHQKQNARAVKAGLREMRRVFARPVEHEAKDEGITIQREPFETWWRDGKALFEEHCKQADEASDEYLMKNIDLARQLDKVGAARIITARCNGRMFGYLVSFVSPSLNQSDTTTALQTEIYAAPDVPGLGRKLQRASIEMLRDEGVGDVQMRAGVLGDGPRLGAMYRRMGAVDHGKLYRLPLAVGA